MKTSRNVWTPAGTITASQAALGVTARDAASVTALGVAKIIEIDLRNEYEEVIELRPWSDGNADDDNVFQCYAMRGKDDSYSHVGALTATQGTQPRKTSSTKFLADNIVAAIADNSFLCATVQKGNNQSARVFLDTNGYTRFLLIASTLATTTAGIDWALSGGDVHALVPQNNLLVSSTSGGPEVVTMASTSAGNGANQPCRSALIWTADADMNFKIGTDAADASDPLLPAGVPMSMPVSNTNSLRFYSTAGGAANIIWRN